MVINRIHLGSVVFAKTLVASVTARQAEPRASNGAPAVGDTTVRRHPSGDVLTRRPHPIDRRHHVIEGFHQRHLNPILRRLAQRVT
jgi:hypothetical protein